jgi:CHASE3 domain sensor protein
MDWSAAKYPWLSLLLGLTLVFVWGVISLAHAYDRSLAEMKDSFAQGFMLVERLGGVLDTLARVRTDQQAFLSTGDDRFQDEVVGGAETLAVDISVLHSMAAPNEAERPLLIGLSRSIAKVLDAVAESDDLMERRGKADAIAFFDAQDAAVALARWQAERLRIQIAGRISDRIQSANTTNVVFRHLLNEAPLLNGSTCGAAFPKSGRGPAGSVSPRYARAFP